VIEARISVLDVLALGHLGSGGLGGRCGSRGLVFGHGANALSMRSPDQIKDKRVLAAADAKRGQHEVTALNSTCAQGNKKAKHSQTCRRMCT